MSAPDVAVMFARSVEQFQSRVNAVGDESWARPTPCSDWDVRQLVNHVVGEQRWVAPLLDGKTIEQVGDSLDGDLLGATPRDEAAAAAKDAIASMTEEGAMSRTVHLSFGDTPAEEYAWQLLADHVVHSWDLAVAVGGDTRLDEELVDRVAGWWVNWEAAYRGGGAVAHPVQVGPDASAQDQLLASFGRDPAWTGQ